MAMNNNPKKTKSIFNPPPAFKFIFFIYFLFLSLFALNRYIFQYAFADQIFNVSSKSEIINSYLLGLRFDTIIIVMLLIPLLLFLPWIKKSSKPVKRFLFFYLTIIGFFSFFGLLADIRFYDFFHTHFNFLAYEYLSDTKVTSQFVFGDKFFSLVLIGTILQTSILLSIGRLIYRLTLKKLSHSILKHNIIWFIIFTILFFIGIRGRLDLAPLDWGMAYFSHNKTLNDSSLNGLYTLMRNFNESNHDPRLSYLAEEERFKFVSKDSALTFVQNLLYQENDKYIEPDKSIKKQIVLEKRFDFEPNIVLILMESWAARFTSSITGIDSLTPNFDRLSDSGYLFTNCYGSGMRTNFGIGAVLGSYPSLPGRAILKRYEAVHPFKTLPEILHERGYYNSFVYGGDLAYDNMEGFLRTKKVDGFFGESDFDEEYKNFKWGVPDHLMFAHVSQIIDTLPRPFFISALTLSNHEPWDMPDSSVQRYFDDSENSKRANSAVYADYALGQFIDSIKSKPIFDSTIFLFVSDHAQLYPTYISLNPTYFHIPLLIYSRLFESMEPLRIDKYCSQLDIIPTLLGLIGGDYQIESWGRDILRLNESDSGFAILNLWNRIGIIDPDYLFFEEGRFDKQLFINYNYYYMNLAADSIITNQDLLNIIKPRQEIMHRFMQLADQLSLEKR